MEEAEKLENIRLFARVYGWQEVQDDVTQHLLAFKRNGSRINIWYNRMTVGTALAHPLYGKTQLFRKDVPMHLLEKIFDNPRTHTGKGYARKSWKNWNQWHRGSRTVPKRMK